LKCLTEHNILSKEQYVFRTKLKTDNATCQLTNEILNDLNNRQYFFCDLKTAFDCVNHTILLFILEFCGITDNHYKLYKSYLTDRYQRTLQCNENINITILTWAKIEPGAPRFRFWDLRFSSYL